MLWWCDGGAVGTKVSYHIKKYMWHVVHSKYLFTDNYHAKAFIEEGKPVN